MPHTQTCGAHRRACPKCKMPLQVAFAMFAQAVEHPAISELFEAEPQAQRNRGQKKTPKEDGVEMRDTAEAPGKKTEAKDANAAVARSEQAGTLPKCIRH